MNHFILTRFNLRLWENDKKNAPVRTVEWLKERFILFEAYCLPSILTQTSQNFKWICLFDIDTPVEYRSNFRMQIKQHANPDDEHLITTYLDNDDCLRKDFVERIQKLSEHSPFNTVFSFKYGLQYFTTYNLAIKIPYPNNHFLSYYEKYTPKIRTV